MAQNGSDEHDSLLEKVRQTVVGAPRNIKDPSIFHKLSLVPLLAWIGLGADGLSSSSYGPEEAFRALGQHTYLAVFLALATSLTVFIISYAYSRIIEHFPHGGGGYIVATHTLGNKAGVVSGSALLVDYMLTITVSIAACGDALFSFLPMGMHDYKIFFELFLILILIMLNLRGVKESVTILAPIFIVFVVTHIFMIGYGILVAPAPDRPGGARTSRPTSTSACPAWAASACWPCSCAPTRSAAAPTPASRPSPTACRSCASPGSRPASGPCSTWPPRWPSPPAACSSATCF